MLQLIGKHSHKLNLPVLLPRLQSSRSKVLTPLETQMSTLTGKGFIASRRRTLKQLPNSGKQHTQRPTLATTLTGTHALHSEVRTLNRNPRSALPPPAQSQHRLNKHSGKTGQLAPFKL